MYIYIYIKLFLLLNRIKSYLKKKKNYKIQISRIKIRDTFSLFIPYSLLLFTQLACYKSLI